MLEDKQAWAINTFYNMKYKNGSEKALVRPPIDFLESGLPEYRRGPLLPVDVYNERLPLNLDDQYMK